MISSLTTRYDLALCATLESVGISGLTHYFAKLYFPLEVPCCVVCCSLNVFRGLWGILELVAGLILFLREGVYSGMAPLVFLDPTTLRNDPAV